MPLPPASMVFTMLFRRWLFILLVTVGALGSAISLSASAVSIDTLAIDNWQLLSSDDSIETFTGEVPGSHFKATRHVTELDATIDQVLAALGDGTECAVWLKLCSSAKVIERVNPQEFLGYAVLNMPWPLSNRDLVFRSVRTGEPGDDRVVVRQQAEPEAYPPGKLVRMVSSNAFLMEPLASGKVRLTWTIHSDPGGNVSPRMVNSRAHKETRRDLRSLVKILGRR